MVVGRVKYGNKFMISSRNHGYSHELSLIFNKFSDVEFHVKIGILVFVSGVM